MPEKVALQGDEVSRLRTVLLRLGRRLRKRGVTGLTPSQLSALQVIERHGPVALGELARIEQVGKSTVTKLVAKLENLALIVRTSSTDDGRSALVELTTQGRELLVESSRRADAYLSDQMSTLSPEERRVLAGALPVLERLLEAR